ncbi:transcriptional regulator FilR1 domain-containing protein [Methanosarcina horonobensis]
MQFLVIFPFLSWTFRSIKKEIQLFLDCENSHFFVSEGENKPMMLIVTDKIFALSLLDKHCRVDRHYIVSFEPEALKWGEELFAYYKKNARPIYSL